MTAESTNLARTSSSAAFTFTRDAFVCPNGYVAVPASGIVGLGNKNASRNNSSWWLDVEKDFCVMKYPAKQDGSGIPISIPAGTPWVNIGGNQNDTVPGHAAFACKSAGSGYRLISNTQWQTVARNAEGVAANWSGDAVGSGAMALGHTDNVPPNARANSTDDEPYFSTGNDAAQTVGWEQKRTRSLSNGEVVWDFGGNIWHWISDTRDYNDPLGVNPTPWISNLFQEFSNTTDFPVTGTDANVNRLLFAPAGSFSSEQNTGRLNGGNGSVVRGGTWSQGTNGGLFSGFLYYAVDNFNSYFGFRCAYLPQ